MKKFRLLFVVMVVLFLAVVNSNAQNKTVTTESIGYEGFLACSDDYVTGVETGVTTYWQSKMQIRWKGTYEGVSGKHYSWSMVINDNWKQYIPGKAANRTYVSTSVIECEGIPIATYKTRFHVTLNANGEFVVDRYRDSGDTWICL